MPFFVDKDGNVFRFVENSGTVPDTLGSGTAPSTPTTENYIINLRGGNYTHEIKGDFVQGHVIEFDSDIDEEEEV